MNNPIQQPNLLSETEFLNELKNLRTNLVRISEVIVTNLTSDEAKMLKYGTMAIQDQQELFYNLYTAIPDNFEMLFMTAEESSGRRDDGAISLVGKALINIFCSLSLILYRETLLSNVYKKHQALDFIINYIPQKHSSDPELYETYYIDWLRVPVEIATLSGKKILEKIESSKESASNLLDEISTQTVALENRFDQHTLALEKIINASFKKLASSFKSFEISKAIEKYFLLILCIFLGYLMVSVTGYGIEKGYLSNLFSLVPTWVISDKNSGDVLKKVQLALSNGLPLIICEAFLLYFFRISLNNYYAARDELLQLQLRKALCLFAPQFKAFAGDSAQPIPTAPPSDDEEKTMLVQTNNLDEFAKHIFSPLNSRMNPTPHPLDFLGQVTDAVKKVKK